MRRLLVLLSPKSDAMIPTLQAFARRYGFKSTDHDVFKIQFLMVLAMSVVLGISFDAQLEWRRYATEHHLELMMRGWDVVAWLTLLCAAPGMLFLIRRFPLTLGRIRRNLAGLVVGSSLIYVVVINVRFGLRLLPNLWLSPAKELPPDWSTYLNTSLLLLPIDVVAFFGFFAITYAVDYYFQSRQHAEEAMQLQLQAAQLTSDLSRAELAVLRNQLHPHFIFNSFNAVATLVRQKKTMRRSKSSRN